MSRPGSNPVRAAPRSPFLTRQHVTPRAISAAPATRPTTTDCGEKSLAPSNSSTVREGVTSSAIPAPTSTRAVTIKSGFVFMRGKDRCLRGTVALPVDAYARHAGRVMPSRSIHERSVLGLRPSFSAAWPLPSRSLRAREELSTRLAAALACRPHRCLRSLLYTKSGRTCNTARRSRGWGRRCTVGRRLRAAVRVRAP
jgi:hypothetical protein